MDTHPNGDMPPTALLEVAHRVRRLQQDTDASIHRPLHVWQCLLEMVALRRSRPNPTTVITVIVGPTGAGKSTLLNLALGGDVSPVM